MLTNTKEGVFSTYVEMILNASAVKPAPASVLHVCGDDPWAIVVLLVAGMCSPRMWR